MTRITILLADDHTVVREGLRALLEAEGDLVVIGEARNGREAVRLAQSLRPDVMLMDIGMPLLNGLESARQILAAAPASRVIILSAHSDDEYVEQVVSLGAAGFMLKQSSCRDLAKAIREVHSGRTFFSPAIAKRLALQYEPAPEGRGLVRSRLSTLTPREAEILQLIAEGHANKQVAAELSISIKTVEKHRQNLMAKLDLHDTAGLTRYAIGAGFVESGAGPRSRQR